ncbi:MAG: hypothetical protein LBO09_09360 [Candidatus Peribacteria bacterium]|jgi:soluble cytochrome b562|nr:hypothetical protein [Candidatus Peribacteria bacterium]
MLEKFINEVSKPILEDKGKELNKELTNLFERNPDRKDLETLSTKYGISYTSIEADFLKSFENEDEDDFKRMLQDTAHAYDRYYKKREDKIVDPRFLDFKKTFEILYKNLDKIEKIIYTTNRKINNILLKNP